MKKLTTKHTLIASYVGNATQAIVNNLLPLLFLTFQKQFDISLAMLGVLISVNFGVQLLVDFLASKLVDKIGHRVCLVTAHFLAAGGLLLLGILPNVLSNPYIGIVLSVVVYAIGGGIIEVMISPLVEACPVKNKKAQMSLLHSFYCWGQVAVVLLSTLFFVTVGIEHWKWLTLIWATLPLANGIYFLFVPVPKLMEEGEGMKLRDLLKTKVFWIFVVLMMTAGAAEITISQWSSAFAEMGLKVSKTVGDLFGPCLFAVLMGIARLLYSIFSEKIRPKVALGASGALCIVAYAITAFSPFPALALVGCGLAGFSVGILWPGILSYASVRCPKGGTALFALLALAGDLGCGVGPSLVGAIADAAAGGLSVGLAVGIIFPVLFTLTILLLRTKKKKEELPKL